MSQYTWTFALIRAIPNIHENMNKALLTNIQEYFKTKPISKAWLFGSFARGEEREDSDVDILIQFTPEAKMGLAYFGMICDLEDLLKRPVDLVVDEDLLPFAQESANHDKILIYERVA